MQAEENKKQSEEQLKLINKAYDVLSDPEKRKAYDSLLAKNTISKEEYDSIYMENQKLKDIINEMQKEYLQNNYSAYNNQEEILNNFDYNQANQQQNYTNKFINNPQQVYYNEYNNNIDEVKRQAYNDAYIQDLRNRGYKIKYKKTFKDYFKNFVSIILTILILVILFQIPFIRNLIEDNVLFDIFSIK